MLPWARDALANVPRSEPSTGLARCAFVDLVRDLARPAVDASDDTPSARDDGLAWFKTALGAFAYDKGYRQAFSTLGFPGPDAEYLMALSQLRPARRELDEADAAILDVSCGPGMFAEMFARGSEFPHVVATDYSHAMCARTRDRIMGASVFGGAAVVRADVGDLPFAEGSFLAVHSGAGAHCWPDSEAGAREIARVLRPAGRCVITTVILPEKARKKMLAKGIDAESYAARIRKQNMPFWDADAALAPWRSAPGFENARVAYAEKSFVMIAATKAEANEASNGAQNNAVGRGKASTSSSVAPESPEILNQWWPVAFEHQLDANGDKLAVSLFGEPLVVYRGHAGDVTCVQDRCAHKSCPLSLGYVRDGNLVCRYHGWAYGDSGALVNIPALADERCPKAKVPDYPCRVSDGIVHVWPGDRAACGRSDLPRSVVADKSLRGLETLSWPRLTETREWEGVPWHAAVEITQDFTHLQFVHPNTQAGRAPLLVGGLSAFETRGHAPGGFVAEYVGGSGKGGGRVTFVPPSTVMNESFFVDETSPDGKKAFPLCFVFRFVPVAPGRTAILVQTHQKLFPHVSDAFAKALMNMTKVMSQDQLVLAGQRLRVAQGSPQWNLPIESDKHLLHFTRWRVNAEGPEGPWFLGYDGGGYGDVRDVSTSKAPFHHASGASTSRRVRRGAPSDAGVDKSGVDVDKPLAALIEAGRPAWQRIGVPLWVADAMNAARGSNAVKRVLSGAKWGEGTWMKQASKTGGEESPAPRENPPKTLASNAVAFRRDVETTEKTRNKTSEENTDGVTRV